MTKLITTAGFEELLTNGMTNFAYFAVGSGTTTPTTSDTALDTEIDRIAFTPTVVDNTLELQAFFSNSQGVGSLNEWGVFDAASGGTCLVRGLFSTTYNKLNSEPFIVSESVALTNA